MTRAYTRRSIENDDERLADTEMRGDARAVHDIKDYEGIDASVLERRKQRKLSGVKSLFPPIPEIPGWHLCWLPFESKEDPLSHYMNEGYLPVKVSEVRGSLHLEGVKEGEHVGAVRCREMILCKIPQDFYEEDFVDRHHDEPYKKEGAVQEAVDRMAASRGVSVVDAQEDGFKQFGRRNRAVIPA